MNTPADDVRMRGFRQRTRVADAIAWVDAHSAALSAEKVDLRAAAGRVLATRVIARNDVPPFVRSAMDGYALRAAETIGASEYNPLVFSLAGESLPGRPCIGEVPAGSAVRIMTGAPLPAGLDAVLPAEYAHETAGAVEAVAPVATGKNIGPLGEDVSRGAVVAMAGRRLRPQDLGILASVGTADVDVIRRPRVRVLVTGNELVRPPARRGPFEIYDANSPVLTALVERDGGLVDRPELLPDDPEALRARMIASGADVILVSGGSSVGAEDHAPALVATEGTLAIHGIAMRPSSPSGIGTINDSLVFLLPGNPVSCLCAYDFFAGRAIRRLGGRSADWPYPAQTLDAGRKIVSVVGRVDYVRVSIAGGKAEPLATSGASILSSTTRADGFVVVPEALEGYPPDAAVTVFRYDSH